MTEQTIEENYQAVRDMDPVTDLTGEEFPRGEKKLSEMVLDFFDSIGNKAHNPVVGDVLLDSRAVKDDMNHGVNHTKAVAFAAIPDVISQGKVLDHQRNWKGRGYDSATLGAKIRIGGEDFYELVVVKLRDKNRLYVHAVYTARMGGPLSLNQVFPAATAGGTGTSGNGPAPSESKTAVAPAARRPAGSSTANLGSGSLPVSSIFERLLNVKGGEETRYKIAGKRIEETDNKDLVAIHNLSEEKLMESLELGGFPMPSIAVTRASEGHDNFGDISVVFRKDTIDPKINRANRVFSADAYTPRFPKTEYKLNETELSGLAARVGMSEASLESNVFDGGDKGQMIDKMKGRNEVREAFLKERGIPIEPVLHQPSISGRHASKGARDFLSREDIDFHSVVYDPSVREEYLDALFANSKWSEAAIKRRRDKVNEQLEGYKDNAAEYGRAEASFQQDQEIARGTAEPVKDASSHTEGVSNAIEAHASEFEEYARGLVEPILGEKYIRNNKDRFNSRGEQRSFNELHDEYTLDNIVRVMAENGMRNAESALTSGTGNVSAALSREFPDIEAIRKEKGRIRNLTEEEYKQVYGKADRLLDEVARYLAGVRGDTGYMALDRAIECLTEAFGSKKTEKGIRSFLEKEYGYTGIPDTTMKKIMDLREYMLAIPVRYFEAKPGRAVGLDEIAAVVLPLNASEGLKSSLAAEGVKTVLYDPALPNARREAVSGLEDVRFKLEGNEDTSETDLETLIRENEKLKEANEKLKNQFKLTPKDAVREADIARIARGILKEYNSQYSSKKLQEQMTRLYKYIRNSEDVDMNETARVAAEIGRGVLKQSSKLDTAFAAQYRDLRDQIRNTKIELSQADRQDLDAVGGYSAFRKKYFGRIRLGEGGISVDSLYQELNGQYPELFSADYTHPADQLMAIARVLDETREQVENEYHADMDEMSILIGQKILEEYANVRSTPPTFADRKQEQVEQARKKARAEYRAKMQEYVNGIRKEYTAQIGTARKELAQELDRIKKAREAAEEALAEAEKKGDKQEKQARLKEIRELREEYQEINRQDRSAKYLLKPDMYVESMRKARESHQRSKDREAIYKEVKRLQGWLLRPTDTKHIPKEFRGMVAQFLSEIDYSSQFKTGKNKDEDTKRTIEWNQVKSQLDKIIEQEGVATGEDGSMVQMDIDPDLKKKIEELSQKADDIDKLNELDAYHMKELREVVTALGKAITEANDVKSNERYTKVSEMAEAVLKDIQPKKDRTEYTGTAGGVDKLLNYDMLDPLTMFRKLGPSAYTAWESLRDGLNKKTQKLKEAEDHISRLMEKNNISGKDIREWSGKRAKATTFKLPGGEIRLTTGQIMALYVENRREQAKKHIYSKEGGIKAGDRRVGVHLEKGRIVMVSLPHVEKGAAPIRVSEADVKAITDTLTPQQKALADGIQQFMGKEVASWGNEVSMAMYGYEKFTAREYFPIKTDDNYIPVKESEGGTRRQPTIKNLGMTKSTNEHANNPIIIEDIFDVYTRQVDQMSSYNAYVLPLSDLQKVLNYKDAEAAMSMRQEIGRAFGSAANRYLAKLIDDINGSVNSDKGLGEKLISNMKAASVAGNIRVIIQQPTAYIRALAEIDGKYLAKGAATMTRKDQWEMICKYAPIAQWKDWGFYRMDTSRQMKDILLETDSATQKFVNFTMKPAEMADKFAWNRIWRACEMECMDRHPDLQPGTEKFYQEVGKRFSEIIDKTQVVDSVLHRTQIMRSENGLTKMATSFMGEPLKTMDILYRATLDLRENVPGAKKKAGKAAGAVVSSALLTALVASLPDTLRDDDREKDFGEKYLENLRENMIDNLTLVNNIPWAKDILSIAQGNTPGRTDLGGFQDLYYAYQKIMKLKDGESQYTPQYVAAYTVQMTSKLTGIPVRSIVRDAGSIVDTIFNALGGEADYNWLKQVYSISSQENLSLYVQMMIEAQRQGNTKLAGEIKTDLNKAGIDNDKIGSKIRSVVKKELVSDEAVDPRIDAAAHAKQEMEIDEYRRNVMELAGEGYAQDIIESAIKTRINQLNGDEEADPEEEMKVPYEDLFADVLGGEIEEDAVSIYGSSDVAAAVDKFDGTPKSLEDFNVMAEDILTGKVRDGKKKTEAIGEIKSSITRKYKQAWIDAYNRKDKETYEGIQNKLKQLKVGGKYLYGGDDWISWKDAAKKSQEEKEK